MERTFEGDRMSAELAGSRGTLHCQQSFGRPLKASSCLHRSSNQSTENKKWMKKNYRVQQVSDTMNNNCDGHSFQCFVNVNGASMIKK